MSLLNINAIYRTTEGEGIHLGTPQVFVRFQGCAIGCVNCDSKETWDFTSHQISIEQVLKEVRELSEQGTHALKRVSITGGDPFHPKHEAGVTLLVQALKQQGYFVNIEAAGSRIVDGIFDLVDFISFDVKTPSTGVKFPEKILARALEQYGNKMQIKSVISDKKDFEFTFDIFNRLSVKSAPWVLTPCYEPHEDFPKQRFIDILKWNEEFGAPFRVIGQQHKWIHGPRKLNV